MSSKAELVTKISRHLTNIQTTLSNAPATFEPGRRNVVKLGVHWIRTVTAAKQLLSSGEIDTENYLRTMSHVFEALEKMVSFNHQNLCNKALLRHTKATVNTMLVASGVMEVVNSTIDQTEWGNDGDDDNDPPEAC